jgi:hypothetical protein
MALSKALPKFNQLLEGVDFYREGQKIVFTSIYHLKRGYCCHSKCRHCPYGLGIAQKVAIEIMGVPAAPPAQETPSGNPDSFAPPDPEN